LVAVIGAGPSGLTVCKELLAAGLTPVCFEQKDNLGGVFASSPWPFDLTSSSVLTPFSDFTPPDSVATMWSKNQYIDYLHRYVDHFELNDYIQYGKRVTRVAREQIDGSWQVEIESQDGQAQQVQVSALVVCSGTHTKARIPEVAALAKERDFQGDVIHSGELQWPPESASQGDALRVVIVGLGETGSDLALLFTKLNPPAKVTISARESAGWVAPRCRGQLPADLLTNRITWGLPRYGGGRVIRLLLGLSDRFLNRSPIIQAVGRYNLASRYAKRGPYGTYGTKTSGFVEAIENGGAVLRPAIDSLGPGKRVTFNDGTTAEADLVVLGTGFSPSLPFLEENFPECAAAAHQPSSRLYGHVIPPDETVRGLYFVGFARPGFGAIPPLAELQARWIAGILQGELELPTPDDMRLQILEYNARRRRLFRHHADSLPALVDYLPYTQWLAQRVGCDPDWTLLAQSDPELFMRVLYGAYSPAHFRLHGPGADPVSARERILALPKPPKRAWAIGALIVYILCHAMFIVLPRLSPVGVGLDENASFSQRLRWLGTFLRGTGRGMVLKMKA
jgi:dimethylaniline monooxygenase (N-oxide forming)